MDGIWCTYRGKNPPFLLVFNQALCFGLFLSQGAEGEMVFPTEETPFKSDNTTELFNSGQSLPLLALGASVTDLGRVIAGWWGGLSKGLLCLVSRPKSPKPLLCADFSGHVGKPSCSHSPGTTQSCFRVQWLRPACHMPSSARECCQPQHKPPSLWHCLGGGAWLQLVPTAWLLLPGGCRLHWWCWHGFRQMAAE